MTFSLVGRCARTGMLGAVVTTSSMAVGSRCPFAKAGVGAALTQHRTDPRLGPMALELMSRGFSAPQTMNAIVAGTPHRHWRQLALIDAAGRTAVYSGDNVRAERGEAQGGDCAAIANIVRSSSLPAAMVQAFEREPGAPLAARLVAALEAGEEAGGEFQPVTSAALVIAHRESFPFVDLRVDDSKSPIAELKRLWLGYQSEADAYVVRAIEPDNATRPAAMIAAESARTKT